MEEAGVKLVAQGADAFEADVKSAAKAVDGFGTETKKAADLVQDAAGRWRTASGKFASDAEKAAAGVEAIAPAARKAGDAVEKAGNDVQRAGRDFSAFGEIATGALRHIGTIGVNAAIDGFAALGRSIVDGVGDAREAARLMASTEQTIKTMGNAAGRSAQDVVDLATALSDASGKSLFGDDQIQQASNLLLTFGNIKGETFDLATALTVDLAQALGGAPADQAMMLGKALNDPVKGLTALGRAGLTFSEEQKAVIEAMVETGDIAGAQAIIIEELNRQVGGQAAAAAEAAGGIEQFKARMGETFETIATQLLPILNDFGDWLNSPEVTKAIDDIAAALVDAFGWAADNIPPTIKLIVDGAQELVTWFGTVSDKSGDLGGAVEDLSGVWTKASEVVTNVINAYLNVAQAVLPVIQRFIADHGTEIEAFFRQTWASIVEIVTLALDVYNGIVPPVLNAIAGFINDHGSEIQKVLGSTWDIISALITGTLETIKGVFKTALALINGDWEGAWNGIKGIVDVQAKAIGDIVTGFLNIIAGIFDTTLDDILGMWEDNWNMLVDIATSIDWVGVGQAAVDGILDGLRGAWGSLVGWITDRMGSLVDSAMEAIGASSPAKDWMPVGEFAVMGLMQGFENMWPALTELVSTMSDDLIETASDIGRSIQDAIAGGFGAVASIDRQMASNLEKLAKIPEGFYRKATELQLKAAEEQAKAFADPETGAKFFAMRSKQILEFQELQQKINKETDADTKKRLQQQQILILAAQEAEQSAFQAQFGTQDSPAKDIARQLAELFNNAEVQKLQKEYAEADSDKERARIMELIKQAAVAVNDTGIGHDINALLTQLEIFTGMYVPPGTASPPASGAQMASPSAAPSMSTRTFNMPIYTNNTPAALQQSLAIANAVLP